MSRQGKQEKVEAKSKVKLLDEVILISELTIQKLSHDSV